MTIDVQASLKVTASDGVALATDVVLPKGLGPWPTVLMRTYLGKAQHTAEALGWATQGFVCVVQDVRGRFDSGGSWRPYTTEHEDGSQAVEWILGQPWSNGRIAAVGGSYGAFSAWSAALAHPAVQAVISAVPAMGTLHLQPEDGGVLPLLSRVSWWMTHMGARCPRSGLADAMLGHVPEVLRHLPVVDLPDHLWVQLPGWAGALVDGEPAETESAETRFAETWSAKTMLPERPLSDADLANLSVAALHVGGWHDPFCSETLRQFALVGRNLEPRPPRGLVLGPWWHRLGTQRRARYGERDYGEASRFPLGRFQADWLRQVLDGCPAHESTIRVFLGGENRWLNDVEWQESPQGLSSFYLDGDGLTVRRPVSVGQSTFVYDPHQPAPCRRTPLDERAAPTRQDVLVASTPPLKTSCYVVGAPRAVLWGSTDAVSVDWVVRLLEVTGDGRRLYLAHGLVDAGLFLANQGQRIEPGAPHQVEIQLSPLGMVIPAGSRLRLEISGSAFPSYARNLASGEPRLTGTKIRPALQTVHWGPDIPTFLELPLCVDLDVDLAAIDETSSRTLPDTLLAEAGGAR